MRQSRRPIVIVSRRSPLAQRQAELIGRTLGRLNPHVAVEYRWIESEGDQLSHRALNGPGGKGLFVRAIEKALLAGQADIAVHSLKDLPAGEQTLGLIITAITRRADARDCLVANDGKHSIDQLAQGATVGTSSPRRAAQLLSLRNDLNIQPIHGNIQTRIAKVVLEGQFDATLVAVAALDRTGIHEPSAHPLAPSVMLPAAGQGALAVQCRVDDHVSIRRCLPINEPVTAAAVSAERDVVAGLEGDCHSAIGVYVEPVGDGGVDGFRMRAKVLADDGSRCVELDQTMSVQELSKFTKRAIADLIARGARQVLAVGLQSAGQPTQTI